MPTQSVLIAVSGGVDSMTLAHLFFRRRQVLGLAHCNFNLRGQAADQDEALVQATARRLGVRFHSRSFDTAAYAQAHGVSIQMAARSLRYAWFEALLESEGYEKLATAHHASDQVETMLYHHIKGTGVAGLRGIPLQNATTIRPLLFATRQEIESYAQENALAWREDDSNETCQYSRNRLRLDVIPRLRAINPSLEKTMMKNARTFESLEKLLAKQAGAIRRAALHACGSHYTLKTDWFDEAAGGYVLLTALLKPFGFHADQCFSIAQHLTEPAQYAVGKQYHSSDYGLSVDRGKLIMVKQQVVFPFYAFVETPRERIQTPWAVFSLFVRHKEGSFTSDQLCAYMDLDRVTFPLIVRSPRSGDVFVPLGMKGKKKLSDFMIDQKIPLILKKQLLVFESKGEVIWIAGHRINDRYKITAQTRHSLIIKMQPYV